MDNSRDKDLLHLWAGMHSPRLPDSTRRKAYNSFETILVQVKDRELQRMRGRLTAALRARASAEDVELITEDIKEMLRVRNRNRELRNANH